MKVPHCMRKQPVNMLSANWQHRDASLCYCQPDSDMPAPPLVTINSPLPAACWPLRALCRRRGMCLAACAAVASPAWPSNTAARETACCVVTAPRTSATPCSGCRAASTCLSSMRVLRPIVCAHCVCMRVCVCIFTQRQKQHVASRVSCMLHLAQSTQGCTSGDVTSSVQCQTQAQDKCLDATPPHA